MAGRKKKSGKTLTRSVRFTDREQLTAIDKAARNLKMSSSTFLRVCALAGAKYDTKAVETADLVRDIEQAIS